MENESKEVVLKQYLLGELDEIHQQRLEQQLLTEADSFEELLIAEDELIDCYLEGTLSDDEDKRFNNHFLATAERKRALGFAKSLRNYVSACHPENSAARKSAPDSSGNRIGTLSLLFQRPLVRWSFATALLLVFAGALWVILTRGPLTRGPESRGTTIAVTLSPGAQRSEGEIKRVTIPPEALTLQLTLDLERNDSQSYRAIVQTDAGRGVFTSDVLETRTTGQGNSAIVNVPARLLHSGDYQLRLISSASGQEQEVRRYY